MWVNALLPMVFRVEYSSIAVSTEPMALPGASASRWMIGDVRLLPAENSPSGMSVTHSLTVSLQLPSGFRVNDPFRGAARQPFSMVRVNVSDPEWVTGKLKAPLESVSAVMTGVVDAETVTPGSLAPAPSCTVPFTAAVYDAGSGFGVQPPAVEQSDLEF